jgi:hypothetical protein
MAKSKVPAKKKRTRTGAGGRASAASKKTAKSASTAKAGVKILREGLPIEQWSLPASFSQDGTNMATLEECLDNEHPTLALSQLSPEQLSQLVSKRIELQPDYEIMLVGAGPISKSKAIAEVKSRSEIGMNLIEIEQRAMRLMEDHVLEVRKKTS